PPYLPLANYYRCLPVCESIPSPPSTFTVREVSILESLLVASSGVTELKHLGDFESIPRPTNFLRRFMATCIVDDRYIYILGGTNTGHSTFYSAFWRFDTVTETFTALANYPLPIAGSMLWEQDDYLYSYSGVTTGTSGTTKIYRYNMASNAWQAITGVSVPRPAGLSAYGVHNSMLYRYGGQNGNINYGYLEIIDKDCNVQSSQLIQVNGKTRTLSRSQGRIVDGVFYVPKGLATPSPVTEWADMLEIDLTTGATATYPIDDVGDNSTPTVIVGGEMLIFEAMGP